LIVGGVTCVSVVADVADRERMRAAFDTINETIGPTDVLMTAAGVCDIVNFDNLQVGKLEETMRINFMGVVYAIEAVLPEMLRRGEGQIVGLVSLTAICPLPFENAYSASKAAVAAYLQSLRPPLRRRGVQVICVYPGFIRTPLLFGLLEGTGAKMPRGSVSAETAAVRIIAGIRKGRRVVGFPRRTTWPVYLARLLPGAALDWVMTRITAQQGLPH
jgi:short-subunit dehydrogenase